MSSLYAFLHPADVQTEKEVYISDRFKDENGNVVPFKIRALAQEETEKLARQSRKTRKVDGQKVDYVDDIELSHRIAVAATVFPDFSNAEICERYGTLDPLEAVGRMLKSGEFKKLMDEISDFSGYDDLESEAKN